MNATLVTNMPLQTPTHFTIGSFTTGNFQPPQGEVMKLVLPTLDAAEPKKTEPIVGKHIREAIEIVKDWKKNP